jgi:dynein intermediate chain
MLLSSCCPSFVVVSVDQDILNSVSSLISVPASAPKAVVAAPVSAAPSKRAPVSLALSNALHTDILPGEAKILYEQSTQTEESKRQQAAKEAAAAAAASGGESGAGSASAATNTTSVWDRIAEDERDEIIHERDDLRVREVELLGRIRELTSAATTRQEQEEAEKEAALHRELPRAEAEKIEKSEEFGAFLDRSSKIMERLLGFEATKGSSGGSMLGALANRFDYMEDYSAPDENEQRQLGGSEGKLTPNVVFAVEGSVGSTSNRPITSIHWSQKYPELLSASYASNSEDERADAWMEPDGSVLVWNLHMAKRPEYSFTCQSAIHTAQFHPAHPKLLVGGCENGQLLIWDMRTSKATPVNRSSLSHGHTHPVFSLTIQSLNSGLYQIVSCSSDGQVCIWTENNLHRPLHDIQLVNMRPSSLAADGGALLGSRDDITTTMFDLPGRDTNSMILGSDEGRIYKARIHEQKESERIYETIQAHDAPMTAIEFHPMSRGANAGSTSADLFLTASYDWTVKLWSHKLSRPLYTFEAARDYVYSAAWCPSNPYVFASGDGTGKLDIWSLAGAEDAEVPALSVQVGAAHAQPTHAPSNSVSLASSPTSASTSVLSDATDPSAPASGLATLRQNHAISKLKWNDAGSMIACGTSSGSLHLYDVSSDLSTPSREATDRFYETVSSRITQPH